ncbi:MAG: hypothetical protein JEY97_07435 [Bacteroidales bacterium]|nr:hypothetical protein [Bacteroidales bacterium]
MKSSKDISFFVLIAIVAILSVYRISNVSNKEISWDVLGYYLPLPATFIYDEPLLNEIDWLREINDKNNLTGTLYMVSSNGKGEPMYFFFFGMAILFLPFFFIGHFAAFLFGFPVDGFSPPYQYSMVVGGIIYTIIGLIFLRKILRYFFSDGVTAIVLLIIVFSTNYTNHLTLKNLETVNLLFMLNSIVIWYTIKWHNNQKLKYMAMIGSSLAFIALVKPSEIIIGLLPLFWNVFSKESFKQKISLLIANKNQIFVTIGIGIIIVSPQIIYWIIKTGYPLYDTYKNPGVGLDLLSPHIIESLFSYRKGWLIYTPVMIFSLIGFYIVYKKNRNIFFACIIYFLISFFIIASWSEWWYGAGFSNRPVISIYPVLAICLGYFLNYLRQRSFVWKVTFILVVLFFTFLNQFQWWQLRSYILDPYRTTSEYYWATFLKTSVQEKDKELLLVKRDFTGKMNFDNKEDYKSSIFQELTFDDKSQEGVVADELGNSCYQVKSNQEYILTTEVDFWKLTDKDHVWVVFTIDVKYPAGFENPKPCLVVSMNRKEGNYNYFAPEMKSDSTHNRWERYQFEYLTPEIRNRKDDLKFYIWNRGKGDFLIDNFKVEIFEKKLY